MRVVAERLLIPALGPVYELLGSVCEIDGQRSVPWRGMPITPTNPFIFPVG